METCFIQLVACSHTPRVIHTPWCQTRHTSYEEKRPSRRSHMPCSRVFQTRFIRADILVLVGPTGVGRMTPPASARISAGLKRVQGHGSPVSLRLASLIHVGSRHNVSTGPPLRRRSSRVRGWAVCTNLHYYNSLTTLRNAGRIMPFNAGHS